MSIIHFLDLSVDKYSPELNRKTNLLFCVMKKVPLSNQLEGCKMYGICSKFNPKVLDVHNIYLYC